MADPQDARTLAFGALVSRLRTDIEAILKTEMDGSDLRYSDDGIKVYEAGGRWSASIWRRSDAKNVLDIECRRGVGIKWQVLVVPASVDDPMFVLSWPDPGFENALRTAVAAIKV